MSDVKTLADILKIAVVGLQNSSNYQQALPEEVSVLVNAKDYTNDSQRFLDAAALTSMQAELSRVPEADSFDELPDIPEETLQPLNSSQGLLVERLFNHEHRSPGKSALLFLKRFGYALPDTIFCELMEEDSFDKTLRFPLSHVASARSRWLTGMNKRWASLLGSALNAQEFHQLDLVKQKWHLANIKPQEVAPFCREHWNLCNANGRRVLLAYLRSYPDSETVQWLAGNLNDKSAHLKRELTRWFVSTEHPQAEAMRQKAAAQLALYLDSSKPRKPDLNVPEKLSDELIELAINDQDYLGVNLAKPVQRLAQLLVLTGPQLWAQQLQCSSAEAMARLLKTRFAGELQAYLLEAALYHQDESATQSWCKEIDWQHNSALPDLLAIMLYPLGPVATLRSLGIFLEQKNISLLLSVKLWQQLAEFNCTLKGEAAMLALEQWCQYSIQPRKKAKIDTSDMGKFREQALNYRYFFDFDCASKLPLWLDLKVQDVQQNKHWQTLREKDKNIHSQLDLCESLFQLKTELQTHREAKS